MPRTKKTKDGALIERPDPYWTEGKPCIGAHPCPSPLYPNHHDAKCACTFEPFSIQEIDRCELCGAIVCTECKRTIL